MDRSLFVVLAAFACACTQDFDKFLGDSGSSNGDGGAKDSAVDAPTTCTSACLASASTCGQSCVSGFNTCVGACGNSQSCKSQCKGQETTCQTICINACEPCADAGCTQSQCQGALP